MHTSFTTLVESGDKYALVKQTPVLGSFVASLHIISFPPFSVVHMMPSFIKSVKFISEYRLKNYLTSAITRVMRCQLPQNLRGIISLQF